VNLDLEQVVPQAASQRPRDVRGGRVGGGDPVECQDALLGGRGLPVGLQRWPQLPGLSSRLERQERDHPREQNRPSHEQDTGNDASTATGV